GGRPALGLRHHLVGVVEPSEMEEALTHAVHLLYPATEHLLDPFRRTRVEARSTDLQHPEAGHGTNDPGGGWAAAGRLCDREPLGRQRRYQRDVRDPLLPHEGKDVLRVVRRREYDAPADGESAEDPGMAENEAVGGRHEREIHRLRGQSRDRGRRADHVPEGLVRTWDRLGWPGRPAGKKVDGMVRRGTGAARLPLAVGGTRRRGVFTFGAEVPPETQPGQVGMTGRVAVGDQ